MTVQTSVDRWMQALIEPDAKNQWVIYNGRLVKAPPQSTLDCKTDGKELSLILPKEQIIEDPIYLVHITDLAMDPDNELHYKTQIIAEEGAVASLVECYIQNEGSSSKLKADTEILLKRASTLDHTLWMSASSPSSAEIFTDTQIEQAEKSQYHGFLSALGYAQQGSTVRLLLEGQEAEAEHQALFLPRHTEESKLDCSVQHLSPSCRTKILARSVVDDYGKFDFTGKIKVNKGARHSVAGLENKNILLSPTAYAQTCPELEIHHDDIQCSHGATIGHLDEDALFYLKSRGIPEKDAKQMIIQGFIQPILSRLRHTLLQAYLGRCLHEHE